MKALWIEGYTDQLSYAAGETAALSVSTSGAKFEIEIVREGAEPRTVLRQKDLEGRELTIPDNASTHGCRWEAATTFKIEPDWPSGYYTIRLRTGAGGDEFTHRSSRRAEASCFFIVRPEQPGRDSKILLQLSTNTYNAYNNWGGTSLYGYHGKGGVQGRRVSFDRPPASQFFSWEAHFVRWAERAGYTLDYAANSDLELRPEIVQPYKLILSVGHDEYWSAAMRDTMEDYIGAGGNVAFFSGNAVCWQVRTEDKGRALTSWKQEVRKDPLFGQGHDEFLSTLWSHHLVGRPENKLTGVGFLWGGYHLSHGQLMDGSGGYTVHRPDHWIFERTGLARGNEFGAKNTIVGYECDGCELTMRDGLPEPTHRDGTPESFIPLATAPARWHPDDCEWYEQWEKGRAGQATMGLYTRGGTVFTAATTDWAHGLSGGDPVVERITRNVLDRLTS